MRFCWIESLRRIRQDCKTMFTQSELAFMQKCFELQEQAGMPRHAYHYPSGWQDRFPFYRRLTHCNHRS